MSDIDHRYGDCTGHWRLIGTGEERSIRCDRCSREYNATPTRRMAAIDENYAGIYLRRLAAEGAAHLDRRVDD
jgi:hypothetical protein